MPNLRILFQSYKKVVVFLFFAEKDIPITNDGLPIANERVPVDGYVSLSCCQKNASFHKIMTIRYCLDAGIIVHLHRYTNM